MHTTRNEFGVPCLLVKIAAADRKALSEKTITTNTGEETTLYLNSPWAKPRNKDGELEQEDKNELAVRYGVVIGMSVGVGAYRKGDIAIFDYKIDIDPVYTVAIENGDKIVRIPCVTTYCKSELIASKGDEKFIERSTIVQKTGEVDQLSLVYGVVRSGKFIPNDHYVFCEPPLPTPRSMLLFADAIPEETYIERTVLFAAKNSELTPKDVIIAIPESNIFIEIGGRRMEIIEVTDILAIKTEDENKTAKNEDRSIVQFSSPYSYIRH